VVLTEYDGEAGGKSSVVDCPPVEMAGLFPLFGPPPAVA
jgi:hypothetical protein